MIGVNNNVIINNIAIKTNQMELSHSLFQTQTANNELWELNCQSSAGMVKIFEITLSDFFLLGLIIVSISLNNRQKIPFMLRGKGFFYCNVSIFR